MKTRNKAELTGYLGCDPKLIILPGDKLKAVLRLATDHYCAGEAGTLTRITTWHEIIVIGKLAETIPNNYIKGSHLLVEGRIEYRTYTDKQGCIHHAAQIHAFFLMNLDR